VKRIQKEVRKWTTKGGGDGNKKGKYNQCLDLRPLGEELRDLTKKKKGSGKKQKSHQRRKEHSGWKKTPIQALLNKGNKSFRGPKG